MLSVIFRALVSKKEGLKGHMNAVNEKWKQNSTNELNL